MERQERGKIINIASINGQNPAALVCVYNTEFIICKTKSISFDTKFIIFDTKFVANVTKFIMCNTIFIILPRNNCLMVFHFCSQTFYRKRRNDGELPLKNDDFRSGRRSTNKPTLLTTSESLLSVSSQETVKKRSKTGLNMGPY